MNLVFWIAFFAVMAAIFLIIFSQKKEGFASLAEYDNISRERYLELGKNRYNQLADQIDIFRPGVTKGMTESEIKQYNAMANEAIKSSELQPMVNMNGLTNTESNLVNSDSALPLENNVLKAANKCEAVKGRDACSILGNPEYKNCGVCILGGTDTMEKNKGSFIGGMLILDRDRRSAEAQAKGTGKEPLYEPTTGECPAGYMFVDQIKCNKAVNRQNCKEAGQNGGFAGGRTIEGKQVVEESCAFCPQSGEENTFIYEPKKRSFPIALRVITPDGTGINTVKVEGFNASTQKQEVLAQGQGKGGEEIYLNLSGTVSEGQDIKVQVVQQFPHRPRGKPEVFQVGAGYIYTREQAQNVCSLLGTDMATYKQITDSFNAGGQLCSYGHYKDDSTKAAYYMQVGELRKDLNKPDVDTSGWCGRGVGVRNDTIDPEWTQGKFAAWCYGVKPPVGDYGTERVQPFFATVGNASIPSQENLPSIVSQHGDDYVAPYRRGVILQWEMRSEQSPVPRRASVEPSIVSVMNQSPNTVTLDGFKMFKLLRRLGMFSTPTRNPNAQIMSPNSNTNKNIMANQYWIWSNQKDNPEFYFTAKVPGTFKDPFYVEDMAICPRGPLVADKVTLDLLKVSPCLKEGQGPGKYSVDCLKFLFLGAGGDIYNGRLSPINGDINKLMFDDKKNALEQDEILDKLNELYSIATKGRDSMGVLVSPNNKKARRAIINSAGLDLFGKEIVTPCEEVTETPDGNIVLVPKTAPFDSECLDYLYLNTGTDKSRGMEPVRNTTIGATYTAIGDRFSGLLYSEKAPSEERDEFPFQTCQRGGSAAPVDSKGKVNSTAVQQANAYAAANGGSLVAAQDYFNKIFKDANMSVDGDGTPDLQLLKRQEDAIGKCFGIKKVIDPKKPSGCGLMARYVAILRSMSGVGAISSRSRQTSSREFGARILLSQVQVFNDMKEEIGKGKKAAGTGTGAQFANDGNTIIRDNNIFMDTDSEHDKNIWFIDLDSVNEVRGVKVYNKASDKGVMSNAIVLLADENKKIIAHKVLSSNFTAEIVTFSKQDLLSPILPGDMRPGISLMLESAVMTDWVLAPNTSRFDSNWKYYSDAMYTPHDAFNVKQTAGLIIQPPLCGINGTISIAFASRPDYFLAPWTNAPDGAWRVGFLGKDVWIKDSKAGRGASWIVRPALSGEPGWFSLQNVAYQNLFLCPWPQGGVFGWTLAYPIDKNDITHQMLAGWRAIPSK